MVLLLAGSAVAWPCSRYYPPAEVVAPRAGGMAPDGGLLLWDDSQTLCESREVLVDGEELEEGALEEADPWACRLPELGLEEGEEAAVEVDGHAFRVVPWSRWEALDPVPPRLPGLYQADAGWVDPWGLPLLQNSCWRGHPWLWVELELWVEDSTRGLWAYEVVEPNLGHLAWLEVPEADDGLVSVSFDLDLARESREHGFCPEVRLVDVAGDVYEERDLGCVDLPAAPPFACASTSTRPRSWLALLPLLLLLRRRETGEADIR